MPARANADGIGRCGARTRSDSASVAIPAWLRLSQRSRRACGGGPTSGCVSKVSRRKCWPRGLRDQRLTAPGADRQPETKEDTLAMTRTKPTLSAETGGTEITRFNALRHGVLSRYPVVPWEDAGEYSALVAALADEHGPQGP